MNKRRIAVLVVLMALTLAAGAAAEFEVGDELRVVNCKEYVTLREEASKSADALARIPLGQKIVCLEDDNGESCACGRTAGGATCFAGILTTRRRTDTRSR